MVNGDQAAEHQEDSQDDREMDRGPDVAAGDDLGRARRVVLRRDGVDEIANPAEDRSDDGRDAPDPVHPPDLICTVSHRFHHYPHIDSATIYEEMSSPWERG